MNLLFAAALELQSVCQQARWKFCFIGGLAVQRWGLQRQTKDADLTLLTGFGNEEPFIDQLLARFAPRRPNAREFALQSRVLLVENAAGIPFDIALGAIPFEEHSVARASPWQISPEYRLVTCSAEDLIVHKAFANRALDWADIENILLRQHAHLDLNQVRAELTPLVNLKEQPEILSRLEAVIERCLG